MSRRPIVYGLDIETDTSDNGIDPQVARVRTVALSSEGCDEVFCGDEAELLAELDERLANLPPGVLATWNGAAFDLPFLADRAFVCGVPIGLRLRHDTRIGLRRAPLPGHPGAYRASWHGHHHLDAYRLYRGDSPASPRVPGGLRSLARLVGLRVVEVDRDQVLELEREVKHAYAPGDARLARVLTERRWPAARSYIDRRVPDRGSWVPPWLVVEPAPQVEVEVELVGAGWVPLEAEVLVGAGVGGGRGWSHGVDFDGAVRVVGDAPDPRSDAAPAGEDAPDGDGETAPPTAADPDADATADETTSSGATVAASAVDLSEEQEPSAPSAAADPPAPELTIDAPAPAAYHGHAAHHGHADDPTALVDLTTEAAVAADAPAADAPAVDDPHADDLATHIDRTADAEHLDLTADAPSPVADHADAEDPAVVETPVADAPTPEASRPDEPVPCRTTSSDDAETAAPAASLAASALAGAPDDSLGAPSEVAIRTEAATPWDAEPARTGDAFDRSANTAPPPTLFDQEADEPEIETPHAEVA